ncbi:hypothetical protein HMPREF9622_01547 [Cutibacterium modestum HL037PA3]|uniref:Uncharacterized protein n=1 Tax=Cutibacterium modestum HL044PA1 TaxID=765109 RepID=A0ABP2K706_9ACTN|nr:hypothetical protein HMPREF9621_01667 [Cutibacterium modestum HL037PA2]EFS92710.1 hypothetical protein HMPREF9607_01241 [Cutibacterium modestum HL044PA1]EFT15341.1 hypothetical protein HMPREF9622_01547 [Cutibacterium modestum HL037PA3]
MWSAFGALECVGRCQVHRKHFETGGKQTTRHSGRDGLYEQLFAGRIAPL